MFDVEHQYACFVGASITFSGDAPLTVQDIEKVIVDKVLPKRPLEVALPFSRALLARTANAAPEAAFTLAPVLTKKGLEMQEKLRKGG